MPAPISDRDNQIIVAFVLIVLVEIVVVHWVVLGVHYHGGHTDLVEFTRGLGIQEVIYGLGKTQVGDQAILLEIHQTTLISH